MFPNLAPFFSFSRLWLRIFLRIFLRLGLGLWVWLWLGFGLGLWVFLPCVMSLLQEHVDVLL